MGGAGGGDTCEHGLSKSCKHEIKWYKHADDKLCIILQWLTWELLQCWGAENSTLRAFPTASLPLTTCSSSDRTHGEIATLSDKT